MLPMVKIEDKGTNFLSAETKNEMYAKGYRFFCDGNYRESGGCDPWSGMPNTTSDVFFFETKPEAEQFAKQQHWIFNPKITATVYALPPHTETREEARIREEKERQAKAARRAAREAKEAKSKGVTVEELWQQKAIAACKTRYLREIRYLEQDIADYQTHINNCRATIQEKKDWIAAH